MKWTLRAAILPAVAFLVVPFAVGAEEQADAKFRNANAEYAGGNFKGAIAGYDALVRSGEWSGNLFYNLANSHFRNGDLGRAVLNYERTLEIEHEHPEAQANLRLTREQAHALELAPAGLERYLGVASANTYAAVAAVLFWIAIIFSIWRPGGSTFALSFIFLMLAGGCAFGAFALENEARDRAIVVGGDVEARVATADTAKSVLALPPGSEVRILQQRGDWSYAALPNNQRGWIAAGAAERVRL